MKLIVVTLLLLELKDFNLASWVRSTTYDGITYNYYHGGDDTISWNGALTKCRQSKPSKIFAEVTNADINLEIAAITDGYTWLGGTDSATEGVWIWFESNIEITWTNWASGEPNNHKGTQHCLQINRDGQGRWDDEQCVDGRGYVCQIASSRSVPSEYSELLIYDQWRMPRTFWGARKQCETIGARLVQITDDQSKEIIQEKMKEAGNVNYWVDMEHDTTKCSVLNRESSAKKECNEELGFVCEIVWPNSMSVSNEHPVVAKSDDLRVDCSASGYPLPDVAWYKDDRLVSNQEIGSATSTLVIKGAKPEDAGRYRCIASTTYMGVEKTAAGSARITVN